MARNLPTATMRHGSGCPAQAGLQTGEMGPTADSGPGPREQICADGHTGAAHRDGPFGVCWGTFQVPQGPPRAAVKAEASLAPGQLSCRYSHSPELPDLKITYI